MADEITMNDGTLFVAGLFDTSLAPVLLYFTRNAAAAPSGHGGCASSHQAGPAQARAADTREQQT